MPLQHERERVTDAYRIEGIISTLASPIHTGHRRLIDTF